MSLDATRWAWMQGDLRPIQKLILLALADRENGQGFAYPSHAALVSDTGADLKSVKKSLKELAELGLISDTGERKGHTKQIVVWALIGVERREAKESKSGRVPETEGFRFYLESSPKTDGKVAQKRTTESISEPIKEPKEEKKRATPCPDEDQIPAEWLEKGLKYGMTELTFRNEIGKFMNCHLQKGTTSANWIRQWDTWCRNWISYGRLQSKAPQSQASQRTRNYVN